MRHLPLASGVAKSAQCLGCVTLRSWLRLKSLLCLQGSCYPHDCHDSKKSCKNKLLPRLRLVRSLFVGGSCRAHVSCVFSKSFLGNPEIGPSTRLVSPCEEFQLGITYICPNKLSMGQIGKKGAPNLPNLPARKPRVYSTGGSRGCPSECGDPVQKPRKCPGGSS